MSDYSKVYKELYEIFKYLKQEELDKLPKDFLSNIEYQMDKEYQYKVVHISDFQNQSMLKETRAILAVLYRDYWANEEEKSEIKNNEITELIKQEEEKKDKYNVDVFYNKRQEREKNKIEEEAEKALVEYKETFFKRILKKIMSFFNH